MFIYYNMVGKYISSSNRDMEENPEEILRKRKENRQDEDYNIFSR